MRNPKPNSSRMAALMRVRELLGNQGAIRNPFRLGTDNGQFTLLAEGHDWDSAFAILQNKINDRIA